MGAEVESRALRSLLIGVVVLMGVLILVGMVAMGVVANRRLAASGPAPYHQTVLDEPAGTHIAGVTALGGQLALRLQGGGPDRVVVVDPASGRVGARVALRQ
jgi:hypothetical protein